MGRIVTVVEDTIQVRDVSLGPEQFAAYHIFKSLYGIRRLGHEEAVAEPAVSQLRAGRCRYRMNREVGAVARTTVRLFAQRKFETLEVRYFVQYDRVGGLRTGRTFERRGHAQDDRIEAVQLNRRRQNGIGASQRAVHKPGVLRGIAAVDNGRCQAVRLFHGQHFDPTQHILRIIGRDVGIERARAVFGTAVNELTGTVVRYISVVAFHRQPVADLIGTGIGHVGTAFIYVETVRSAAVIRHIERIVDVKRIVRMVLIAQAHHAAGFVAGHGITQFAAGRDAVAAESFGRPGVGHIAVGKPVGRRREATGHTFPIYAGYLGVDAGRRIDEAVYRDLERIVGNREQAQAIGVAAAEAVGHGYIDGARAVGPHPLLREILQLACRPRRHYAVRVVSALQARCRHAVRVNAQPDGIVRTRYRVGYRHRDAQIRPYFHGRMQLDAATALRMEQMQRIGEVVRRRHDGRREAVRIGQVIGRFPHHTVVMPVVRAQVIDRRIAVAHFKRIGLGVVQTVNVNAVLDPAAVTVGTCQIYPTRSRSVGRADGNRVAKRAAAGQIRRRRPNIVAHAAYRNHVLALAANAHRIRIGIPIEFRRAVVYVNRHRVGAGGGTGA